MRFSVTLMPDLPAKLVQGQQYPIVLEATATGLSKKVGAWVGDFGIGCEGPCRIIDSKTGRPLGGFRLHLNNPKHKIDAILEPTGSKPGKFKVVLWLRKLKITWNYASH